MKALFALLFVVLLASAASAQNQTDVTAQPVYTYCQITALDHIQDQQVFLSSGSATNVEGSLERKFGKRLSDKSALDALNRMSREGWELAFTTTYSSQYINATHYLLRKRQ